MNPNIRPMVKPHSECAQIHYTETFSSWPGDVRRCTHGQVQVRTQVGPNSRVAGPGTDWWRTLSPFWDWRLYRRAAAALDSAATQ